MLWQNNGGDVSYKFIELFAGIGGFRLGFEKAGCELVFCSEWDKFSQKTYKANFGDQPHGDITKIEASKIPKFDILTAGFPCQPFSTIGEKEGFEHPTQGSLFYDIVRIIKHHNPPAFLLENVTGILNHKEGKTFDIVISSLSELGYKVHYKIINSADFGVPQSRKRVFIVGFLNKDCAFLWPDKTVDKHIGIGQFIESNVDGYGITENYQKSYLFKKNDGRPMVIDKSTSTPMNTLVASYHKLGRLTGIYVKDGSTGLRMLTENECKAAMGFPNDFKFPVSRTQMYRQMGNSVVVPVVVALAKNIVSTLNSRSK